MKKRWICTILAVICLVCCLQPMQVFAAEKKTGWIEENGKTYYIFPETGEKAYGVIAIEGKMCRFDDYGNYLGTEEAGTIWTNGNFYHVKDAEGNIAIGWYKIGTDWHYFNENGHMQFGWLTLGDKTYYLDITGAMVTGKYTIDGETHIFDSNGIWQGSQPKQTGWVKEADCWYYYMPDGSMATGLMLINGKLYIFDEDGKMFADTLINEDGGRSYYASASGALLTGWHCLKGGWYYFYKDGHMAKETCIDNYYVDEKGMNTIAFQKTTLLNYEYGATKEDAAKAEEVVREIARDAMENGGDTDFAKVKYAMERLKKLYSTSYSSNIALGVEFSIAGPLLYGRAANNSDALAMSRILFYMGYENIRYDKYVYLKMDGEYGYVFVWNRDIGYGNPSDKGKYTPLTIVDDPTSVAGTWVKNGNKWYYKTTEGKNHVGWLRVNHVWYYMDQDGSMKTGWLYSGGKWYYLNTNGAMKTGWLPSGSKWYFLDSSGAMKTGKFFADGEYYFADQNGIMRTGWVQVNGQWYYMEPSGAMVFGKKTIGNATYCFQGDGKMYVGWFQDYYGNWYYADHNGVLAKGWKSVKGTYYYFYNDYHMAADTFIDNYYVNESGAWVSSVSVNRDPQHYKGLTAAQAAQADAVAKAIAEKAMAEGGETDREKIYYAAQMVDQYVKRCTYGNDDNKYYRSPYGVFVEGVFTCAGATRAMGRVLEFMGYKWYHPGENQWDHQWVVVKMDGEYAWIDVQKIDVFMGFGNHMDNYSAY